MATDSHDCVNVVGHSNVFVEVVALATEIPQCPGDHGREFVGGEVAHAVHLQRERDEVGRSGLLPVWEVATAASDELLTVTPTATGAPRSLMTGISLTTTVMGSTV